MLEIVSVQLLAQFTQRSLTLLQIQTRGNEIGAHFLLVPRVRCETLVGCYKSDLELRQLA